MAMKTTALYYRQGYLYIHTTTDKEDIVFCLGAWMKEDMEEKASRHAQKKDTSPSSQGSVVIRHLHRPAPYLHSLGSANGGQDRVV